MVNYHCKENFSFAKSTERKEGNFLWQMRKSRALLKGTGCSVTRSQRPLEYPKGYLSTLLRKPLTEATEAKIRAAITRLAEPTTNKEETQ